MKNLGSQFLYVLLGLSVVGVLSAANCTQEQRYALAKCEIGQLPQALETVVVDVTAILLTGGDDWKDQLLNLGKRLAPGQLDCVVAAVAGRFDEQISSVRGQASGDVVRASRRGHAFLKDK